MDSFCPNHEKFHLSWHSRMINWLVVSYMTCGIWWIFTHHSKVQKFLFDGLFCSKYIRFELKKYWGVIFHDTELWCITWIKPDLLVSKIAWGIATLSLEHSKKLEKLYTDGLFLSTANNVSPRKFHRNCVSWHWRVNAKSKEKRTRGLENEIRNLISFHASSGKSENLQFDGLYFSKAYKDKDEKVQKSYVSWHWQVTGSLKKNWLLVQEWHEKFGQF